MRGEEIEEGNLALLRKKSLIRLNNACYAGLIRREESVGQGRSTSTLHYANLQSNFLRSLSKESSILNSLIFESPFQSLDRFIKHTERDARRAVRAHVRCVVTQCLVHPMGRMVA